MLCRKIVGVCRPLASVLLFDSSAAAHRSASIVELQQFQQLVTSRWLFHPADHRPQLRHYQPCGNRNLSYVGETSVISSPRKLEGSDEDPVTDDGSVCTPSLKKEITTKDIFLAKRKETEERLSQRGVIVEETLSGLGGAVHPAAQATGTAHSERI